MAFITVEELIANEDGSIQPHTVCILSERYNGSVLEYTRTKACLVVSLGQDTLVIRVPFDQAPYLRSLHNKLIEAVKEAHS